MSQAMSRWTQAVALSGDRPLGRADATNVGQADLFFHGLDALELPEDSAEAYDAVPDDRLAGVRVERHARDRRAVSQRAIAFSHLALTGCPSSYHSGIAHIVRRNASDTRDGAASIIFGRTTTHSMA